MISQEHQHWITLYDSGMSVIQIADTYGLSRSAVNYVIRRHGSPRPGRKLGRDLVGKRFGRLTVERLAGVYKRPNGKGGERVWTCKCDCGSRKAIRRSSLINGDSTNCGCKRRGPRSS